MSDVDNVAALLEQTLVKNQNIVSVKGQGLKLDSVSDAEDLLNMMRACPDLQVLELVGNTLGVEAAKAISDMLSTKPELERCLWNDMFTGRLRSEIPISLRSLGAGMMSANAQLVELDLSDNAFGPDCAKACVDFLKSPSAYTLQYLRFNNNGLGYGGVILAEALIECHKLSSAAGQPLALKEFVAGRNRLENPGAKALSRAFKTIGTLEEIQLPQNGIQYEGITALASAIESSPNLRHINLNDNTFTEKGAVPMGRALRCVDRLQIVNFGDCLIRTEGARAIGESLSDSNPDLKQLILSFGEVRVEGAVCVCKALQGKEKLERVDLNGNQFGEEGVEHVRDLAKDFQHPDALASLSDDEGSDSEEEDEEDEDDEQDEEEHEQTNGDLYETVSREEELNASNLLEKITASGLLALDEQQRAELMDEFVELHGDAETTAQAFIKISGLLRDDSLLDQPPASSSNHKPHAALVRQAVLQCCDVILADAFERYPNTPMLVVNPLLVHMGLVKSEQAKFRPVDDVRHAATSLTHALTQPYFPAFVKKLVRAVVAKDNARRWGACPETRSRLLQMLYR